MRSDSIRFDLLFDAEELHRSGSCPWTFFAWPTSLADERGLPPDADATRLLAELQQRGLDVAVWVNGLADDTSYFACRRDDRQKLDDLLDGLQAAGIIERGFLESRTHQLFCRLDSGAEDDGPNKPPENTGSAGP